MRALYFGTYDRGYPRNAQVISCLRGAGVDVVEAINIIVKAKTSSELFDARQILLDCIAEEAIRIAERTTE